MESDDAQARLLKLRRKLCSWEKRFEDKYQRRPDKDAIKRNPVVADAYKTYAALKKDLLAHGTSSANAGSTLASGSSSCALASTTVDEGPRDVSGGQFSSTREHPAFRPRTPRSKSASDAAVEKAFRSSSKKVRQTEPTHASPGHASQDIHGATPGRQASFSVQRSGISARGGFHDGKILPSMPSRTPTKTVVGLSPSGTLEPRPPRIFNADDRRSNDKFTRVDNGSMPGRSPSAPVNIGMKSGPIEADDDENYLSLFGSSKSKSKIDLPGKSIPLCGTKSPSKAHPLSPRRLNSQGERPQLSAEIPVDVEDERAFKSIRRMLGITSSRSEANAIAALQKSSSTAAASTNLTHRPPPKLVPEKNRHSTSPKKPHAGGDDDKFDNLGAYQQDVDSSVDENARNGSDEIVVAPSSMATAGRAQRNRDRVVTAKRSFLSFSFTAEGQSFMEEDNRSDHTDEEKPENWERVDDHKPFDDTANNRQGCDNSGDVENVDGYRGRGKGGKGKRRRLPNKVKVTKAMKVAQKELTKELERSQRKRKTPSSKSGIINPKDSRAPQAKDASEDDGNLSPDLATLGSEKTKRSTRAAKQEMSNNDSKDVAPVSDSDMGDVEGVGNKFDENAGFRPQPRSRKRRIVISEDEVDDDDDYAGSKNINSDSEDGHSDEEVEPKKIEKRVKGVTNLSGGSDDERLTAKKAVRKPKAKKQKLDPDSESKPKKKETRKKADTTKKKLGWGQKEDLSIRQDSATAATRSHRGGGGGRGDEGSGIGSSNFRALKLQRGRRYGKSGKFGGFRGRSGKEGKGTSQSYGASGGYGRLLDDAWNVDSRENDDFNESDNDNSAGRSGASEPDVDIFVDGSEDRNTICTISPSFLRADNTTNSTVRVDLLAALKSLTGLDSFLPGQMESVKRTLNRQSNLLVLPTGGGKSLCYQLPTYILSKVEQAKPCTTVVVTPIVALMQDQLRCLPKKLKGAALCSQQTQSQQKDVLNRLHTGKLDVIFISPERFNSPHFCNLIRTTSTKFHIICVDEVHCMTEWSHNFRISYLSLPDRIDTLFNEPCVIALTGTATQQVRHFIKSSLKIGDDDVVARGVVRTNLNMKVVMAEAHQDRDRMLLELLRSDEYKDYQSIIVYTMYTAQADSIAQYLRVRNIEAESYHGDRTSIDRQTIQSRFMSDRLRVVVATVAFGLGVNKSNVRSVIHYCMPKSIENYAQETGRAGRDGHPASCVCFLSREDYIKHRSHAFSDGVDSSAVWRLILKLMGSRGKTSINSIRAKDAKDLGWVSIETMKGNTYATIEIGLAQKELDMRKDVIGTLLSYMEADDGRPLRLIDSNSYRRYQIRFVKSPVERLKQESPIVDALLKCGYGGKGNSLIVDALKVCSTLQLEPTELSNALFDLRKKKEIFYEQRDEAYLVQILRGQKDTDVDHAEEENRTQYLETLRDRVVRRMEDLEVSRVAKLDRLYEALAASATPSQNNLQESLVTTEMVNVVADDEFRKQESVESASSDDNNPRLERLRQSISEYFENNNGDVVATVVDGVRFPVAQNEDVMKWGFRDNVLVGKAKDCKNSLRIDLQHFISTNLDVLTTGRSVARIFHRISSPKFPAYEWNRNEMWGAYVHYNFGELVRLASKVIMELRQKRNMKAL